MMISHKDRKGNVQWAQRIMKDESIFAFLAKIYASFAWSIYSFNEESST